MRFLNCYQSAQVSRASAIAGISSFLVHSAWASRAGVVEHRAHRFADAHQRLILQYDPHLVFEGVDFCAMCLDLFLECSDGPVLFFDRRPKLTNLVALFPELHTKSVDLHFEVLGRAFCRLVSPSYFCSGSWASKVILRFRLSVVRSLSPSSLVSLRIFSTLARFLSSSSLVCLLILSSARAKSLRAESMSFFTLSSLP